MLAPAIELAEGFPVNDDLARHLAAVNGSLRRWPSSAAFLRADGSPLRAGDTLRQPDLAATFRALVEAERGAAGAGAERAAAVTAARDRFYKGDLAERMVRFSREQGGFLELDDLATFSVAVEAGVRGAYRGYDVYACGPWCQGPVVPETLGVLERFDLADLGHNSPRALHLILEALKLSFADREAWYGDPDFVDVPVAALLDAGYARRQAARIRADRAFPGMPEPGRLEDGRGARRPAAGGRPGRLRLGHELLLRRGRRGQRLLGDAERRRPGHAGGARGRRRALAAGSQSWLDPAHPSSLQPGKRPRLTPSPGLLVKDGRLAMVFGTPGGDVQPQAMVQLVCGVLDFGLDPQAAIEAPRVASESFPNSFFPHHYNPGVVRAELRLPAATLDALAALGHSVERWPERSELAGALCAVQVDGPWGGCRRRRPAPPGLRRRLVRERKRPCRPPPAASSFPPPGRWPWRRSRCPIPDATRCCCAPRAL